MTDGVSGKRNQQASSLFFLSSLTVIPVAVSHQGDPIERGSMATSEQRQEPDAYLRVLICFKIHLMIIVAKCLCSGLGTRQEHPISCTQLVDRAHR